MGAIILANIYMETYAPTLYYCSGEITLDTETGKVVWYDSYGCIYEAQILSSATIQHINQYHLYLRVLTPSWQVAAYPTSKMAVV